MKILISEKISQNRYKTPEGFLVCLNCILSRTGKQTYSKSEVFGGDDETEIEVDRTPQEVFSPQTLASFENKPLTIQHPDEDVTVENYGEYAKGFIRNIRKGTDNGQDVMIGDIVVTDKEAIEKIESGELLDLSCGYDCDIQDEEQPQQRNIRGNHVALCEQGRAGCARIVDSIKDGAAFGIVAHGINDFYFTQNGQWAAGTTNLKRYATRAEAERELPKARRAKFDYNDKIEYISVEEFNTWDSVNDDLIESASEEAFKKNIETEIKAGKPVEQAVAIAYSIQRKHQQDNQAEAEKVMQKANEDFNEYMKDSLSESDIEIIEDAIYWAKKKGKATIKGIFEQINEDMPGFVGSNKTDITNYLKGKGFKDAMKDANAKFLYFTVEFSENREASRLKGQKFTQSDISKFNSTMQRLDAEIRGDKNRQGYDKTYIDFVGELDGHKYNVHGARIDLGDGPEYVTVSQSDIDEAMSRIPTGSGVKRLDSVKDSRKTYEVKSKDKQGNIIVKYVKADSFMDAVKQKDTREFVYFLYKSSTQIGTIQKITNQYSAEGDGYYTSAAPGKKFNTAKEALDYSLRNGWKQITEQEWKRIDARQYDSVKRK